MQFMPRVYYTLGFFLCFLRGILQYQEIWYNKREIK